MQKSKPDKQILTPEQTQFDTHASLSKVRNLLRELKCLKNQMPRLI